MNHIELTKHGLLLLIYTKLIILAVVCVPPCSTGIIVKREIEPTHATKLIWQSAKIENLTETSSTTEAAGARSTQKSAAILTTSAPRSTIIESVSSTTPKSKSTAATKTATRGSIKFGMQTSSSTTTTTTTTTPMPTTEKFTTKSTNEKLEDNSVINFNDSTIDSEAVNEKQNLDDDAEIITFGYVGTTTEEQHFDLSRYTSEYNGNDNHHSNETHQKLTNDAETDTEENISNDQNYTYNIDFEHHNLQQLVLTTPETAYFDEKHKEYEMDKSFERDDDRANYTASLSDRQSDRQHFNSDSYLNDIHGNMTEERKQSTYLNKAEVESTNYETSASEIKDGSGKTNATGGSKRAKFMQDGSHVNLTIPNTPEVWALASMKNVKHTRKNQGKFYNISTLQKDSDNMNNGTLLTKQLADWAEVIENNDFKNDSYATNNSLSRLHAQAKPLIISDQDSASNENRIIAVRMTTLPPPILVTQSYPKFTHFPVSIETKSSDVESPVNGQYGTDTTTEGEDFETTITTTSYAIDNSQNELKIKFDTVPITEKPTTTTEMETETEINMDSTTMYTSDATISSIGSTVTMIMPRYDETTIEQLDTTTTIQPVTNESREEITHVTIGNEDTFTTIDGDDDDQTTLEQASTTVAAQFVALDVSTLHPGRVSTSENTERHAEVTRSTTEFVQPTSESVSANAVPDVNANSELTTTIINLNRDEYKYSTIKPSQISVAESTASNNVPEVIPEIIDDFTQAENYPTTEQQTPDIGGYSLEEPDTNAIIAISISVVGIALVAVVVAVLFVMRKRQKQLSYGQRCRPVGMDAYSLDNVSVYNSVRRKGVLRTSKRSYCNAAFDDPGLKNNLLSAASLTAFAQKRNDIYEEFKELPTVTARAEEVPAGCEEKNRYANIIPLPETRVCLSRIGNDEKSEYINANFVKGPKDLSQYYIACQAPLDSTVTDFWRMIWEQNSRVIVMATDLIENGIEQCAEYLPPSFVIDNHVTFGDFHIALKNREVKEKYAMSIVHLTNMTTKTWREVTHFWYQWPDTGVPSEGSSLIGLLLDARNYLKASMADQNDDNDNSQKNNGNLNGTVGVDKSKSLQRTQGPMTVHCSPGTGRTGTIIACDIALRTLEQPTRSVDIPQIVYCVRRGRASAVRTREQYEFIYKVAHFYVTKLIGPTTEN